MRSSGQPEPWRSREFEAYASDFTDYTPAFKRIGMLMVSYAIHEPELFKLLFMQEHTEGQSFENTIRDLGSIADVCMELIQRDYDMTPTESRILFEQMWVHAFGMGALCAMKVCDFSEEEISKSWARCSPAWCWSSRAASWTRFWTSRCGIPRETAGDSCWAGCPFWKSNPYHRRVIKSSREPTEHAATGSSWVNWCSAGDTDQMEAFQ